MLKGSMGKGLKAEALGTGKAALESRLCSSPVTRHTLLNLPELCFLHLCDRDNDDSTQQAVEWIKSRCFVVRVGGYLSPLCINLLCKTEKSQPPLEVRSHLSRVTFPSEDL